MTPPFDSMILQIGTYGIHWYGLLIVTGIILGASIASYLAKKAGEDPEHIWDMLYFAVILGIIGARLYHVVSQPSGDLLGWTHYKEHPLEILYIWKGGLGIYGAIVGGALGVLIYTRIQKLRTLQWLDFTVPGLAIGQAIGRWGNYMNRELYGPPTTLPWGLHIPFQYRIQPYTDLLEFPESTLFHPTFLYESLAALLLCLLLMWAATHLNKRLKEGDIFIGYIIGYAIIRFFTEFLRPDAWKIGALATAQIIALVSIAASVIFFAARQIMPPNKKTEANT